MAVDPLLPVSFALVLAVLALVFAVRYYHDKVGRLQEQLEGAQSSKQSLATTYGRITEQWAPFMQGYPYDPKNFRFLGSPVDGIQFETDRVVFVEFKANESRLTEREARIRELVQAGRVEWLEFRLGDTPPAPPPAPAPAAPSFDDAGWQR